MKRSPPGFATPLQGASPLGAARRTLNLPASTVLACACVLASASASAFCGFYVGKTDAKLFNEASQVILARDGERTVISMLNDYRGELKDFALVVPVPHVLARDQIHIGDRRVFDRLDTFSAPRLAEYFDDDPCAMRDRRMKELSLDSAVRAAPAAAATRSNKALGVTVEASYTVGEYDIVMLSALQSDGLETWLRQNGYRLPPRAAKALQPYIRQDMKFFVARINLAEQAKTGLSTLRPLQFAFESEKFMLPIRLGMVNAAGPQDLIAYVLTTAGRVESTNYRTIKLPANMDVPVFIRGDFNRFYKAMFDEQARRENYRLVFTEYFWDMSWCDPCAAEPLTAEELRQAGVFWTDPDGPSSASKQRGPALGGSPKAMLTRLHIRYTAATFPEDLMFQETGDRENFQTRYVLRHPWQGNPGACPEAARYLDSVRKRELVEARTLASLTGWDLIDVHRRMNLGTTTEQTWWQHLWN